MLHIVHIHVHISILKHRRPANNRIRNCYCLFIVKWYRCHVWNILFPIYLKLVAVTPPTPTHIACISHNHGKVTMIYKGGYTIKIVQKSVPPFDVFSSRGWNDRLVIRLSQSCNAIEDVPKKCSISSDHFRRKVKLSS